jgi:hypothetical protein
VRDVRDVAAPPQSALAWTRVLRSGLQRHWRYLLGALAVFLAAAITLNLLPGQLPALAAYLSMLGEARCLINTGLLKLGSCANMGYPLGHPITIGLPVEWMAAVLSSGFGIRVYTGQLAANAICLAAGLAGLLPFWRKFGIAPYAALVISHLYLSSAIVAGSTSYGPNLCGFILLPAFILADWTLLRRAEALEPGRWITMPVARAAFVAIMVKPVVLFLDGYSYVLVLAASLCFSGVFALRLLGQRRFYPILLAGSTLFAANLIAVALYRRYIPGAASFTIMPIDFFRGQGVDLVALVTPSRAMQVFDWLGWYPDWSPLQFYSDGPNLTEVYLGSVILVSFALFIGLAVTRRIRMNRYLTALLICGAVAFVLSLGPSLKVNDRKPADQIASDRPITFQDYLMPKEAATLDLHTDFVYQHVPGVNIMRALYRWQLLVRLVLLGIFGVVLTTLARSGKRGLYLGVALSVLAVLEQMPNVDRNLASGRKAFLMLQELHQDLVVPMSAHVRPHERIFFLSGQNDILADYLAPYLNAASYSTGGDKNIILAEARWPAEIKELRHGKHVVENLSRLFESGRLDALIVPFFDMRWSSYSWPPSEARRTQLWSDWMAVIGADAGRFAIANEPWFTVVRPKR